MRPVMLATDGSPAAAKATETAIEALDGKAQEALLEEVPA
jgi:hypothetical protein